MESAAYIQNSDNEKISSTMKVDGTYASFKSCPTDCGVKDECYAKYGPVSMYMGRLTAVEASSLDVARAEVRAIDGAYKGGPVPKGRLLRIHIAGDARTKSAAAMIGNAVTRWKSRGGAIAWSYTHAWKNVSRSAWGKDVSILGSIENAEDGDAVIAQGYAPALVVAEFPFGPKPFTRVESGRPIKYIPCPEQAGTKAACDVCKLCFNADKLRDARIGIAFVAHGCKTKQLKKKLPVVQ